MGTQTNVDFPKEVMIKGWGWGGKVYSMGDHMGRENAALEEPKDTAEALSGSGNGKQERHARIGSSMKGLVNYVKEFGVGLLKSRRKPLVSYFKRINLFIVWRIFPFHSIP